MTLGIVAEGGSAATPADRQHGAAAGVCARIGAAGGCIEVLVSGMCVHQSLPVSAPWGERTRGAGQGAACPSGAPRTLRWAARAGTWSDHEGHRPVSTSARPTRCTRYSHTPLPLQNVRTTQAQTAATSCRGRRPENQKKKKTKEKTRYAPERHAEAVGPVTSKRRQRLEARPPVSVTPPSHALVTAAAAAAASPASMAAWTSCDGGDGGRR